MKKIIHEHVGAAEDGSTIDISYFESSKFMLLLRGAIPGGTMFLYAALDAAMTVWTPIYLADGDGGWVGLGSTSTGRKALYFRAKGYGLKLIHTGTTSAQYYTLYHIGGIN